MVLAYLALLGRIVLLGYERIALKKLGHESESLSSAFLFFALATFFLLPFSFLAPLPASFDFLKFVVLSGFVYSFAFWLYTKSLSEGEASLVSPLYNFNVFFLLILASIFLGESLSAFKFAGLLLLVYGASFLNRKKNLFESLKALFTNRACVYMIATSCLIAVGRTIDGFVVQNVDPLIYSTLIYAAISLFLFIYQIPAKKLSHTLDLLKTKTKIALLAGAINAYSYLFLLFAFKEIEISVAEPASMLGMLVTLFFAGRVFKENVKDRLVAVVIMILGAWLLFIK